MPEPFYSKKGLTLYAGDCRYVMEDMRDNSIDSIVCDPPYELNFMGKDHDRTGIAYDVGMWAECLRVLKPGGHLLAFGAPRTYHRMACAVEDAGFEIRDSLMWINGQGFPKSLNVSKGIDKKLGREREKVKNPGGLAGAQYDDDNWRPPEYVDGNMPMSDEAIQWDGWGSALKPAYEPVVVARKPLSEKSIVDNVLRFGTGGINIDGSRVGNEVRINQPGSTKPRTSMGDGWRADAEPTIAHGRYPSNVLLNHLPECGTSKPFGDDEVTVCIDGCPVAEMDQQSGHSKSSGGLIHNNSAGKNTYGTHKPFVGKGHEDGGGASRFFPSFKPSHECALYGMLSVCERVRNVGERSLHPDQQQGSALNPVSEGQSLSSEVKPDSSATPVSTAGENGKITSATIENIAPKVAAERSKEQNVLSVLCAANLCASCATAIVQSNVAIMPDRSKIQMLGLPFTHAYNERILIQSLVWLVESLGNLGTTLTMTEYMKLFGCAADAISTYIMTASQLDSKRSVQRSLSPMEVSIDSSVRWKYNAKAPKSERPSYTDANGDIIRHSTVKPVAVMQWLVRLVTPPGGTCLDPFAGSGTTGEACYREGVRHIAIELTDSYLPLVVDRWNGLT